MATLKEKTRLAELVKEIRGDLSQRWLAARMGVSYTAIQAWEQGVNNPGFPNDGNLLKIADAKGWTLDELKKFLSTGNRPDLAEFERLLDQLKRLHPDQVVRANKVLSERISELLLVKAVDEP